MTATFGKLEHKTLTLQPGLNIIEAPNEWGKSTWCAFLVTMLYGLDTREKTTKTALAMKERYAPWSGAPMSGRIDLNWNGRDITIERSSKARMPMGIFRAYETESGIEIPELNGTNCGQKLLGVERSVFTRAGFLRFTDLPVTTDDSLRRRLNALVTTGDDSGAAEALGQTLKDLKNRCRYNKSGLLPQAEQQQSTLQEKLQELDAITEQAQRFQKRQGELEDHIKTLENHKAALRYAAAQEDAARVQAAEELRNAAAAEYQALEFHCRTLPAREITESTIEELNRLRRAWDSIQMEQQMLPTAPVQPHVPEAFRGLRPNEAVSRAVDDRDEMNSLIEPKNVLAPLFYALGGVAIAAGAALLILKLFVFAIIAGVCGIGALALGIIAGQKHKKTRNQILNRKMLLCRRYSSSEPDEWVVSARKYKVGWEAYELENLEFTKLRGDVDSRQEAISQQITQIAGDMSLSDALEQWSRNLGYHNRHADAHRSLQQAEKHLKAMIAMAKPAEPPAQPDALSFSDAETNRLLSDAAYEVRQLHQKLGQCQGQMDALGSRELLSRELDDVQKRIEALELTYQALELAQNALAEASTQLQRRFAPKIAKRAQELFGQLTGGRFDRLTLTEDMALHTKSLDADVLHSHQWYSDGTVDQLYLALRLAVAESLTPHAPLILDDALVRFDDERLRLAMDILQAEAVSKQVILFTCQSREQDMLQ
jgi:DNA repair exonuclease SbcCD ATPase subunit